MFCGGAPSCEERRGRRRNLTFFLLEGVRHDGTCSGDFRNQGREVERPVDHLRSLRSVAVFPPGGGMRDAKRGEARRGGGKKTNSFAASESFYFPAVPPDDPAGGREGSLTGWPSSLSSPGCEWQLELEGRSCRQCTRTRTNLRTAVAAVQRC